MLSSKALPWNQFQSYCLIRVDPAQHTCQESKSIVDACSQEIEIKIIEMQRMKDSLKMLSAACCGSKHVSTGAQI